MDSQTLLILAFLYGGILFIAAWRAERVEQWSRRLQPLVYSFSLAVYCSSWTFFGAVGSAVEDGWYFATIYLGPILLFIFGWPLLRRLLVMGGRNRVTSVADFIGSRYGKRQSLAAAVTLVAVVGTLPYIALQLKAVSMAWDTVNTASIGASITIDASTSFLTSLTMAWFAVVFGTRILDGPHRHRGMISAVALESLVKLIAFAAVAWLAVEILLGWDEPLPSDYRAPLIAGEWEFSTRFVTQTFLAMVAVVCLPRQFHLMVVENHSRRDMRTARWLFPLYLGLFSLLVIPIALAGSRLFAGTEISADTYVLSLPMVAETPWLSALTFIGGLSAATGMVVVATVTLSIMISNEIVVPLWLRRASASAAELAPSLRRVRRVVIVSLLMLGWLLERIMSGSDGLDSMGVIAFAAAAQLMPAILAGLYWSGGHRNGVLAGLMVGMLVWFFTLLLPQLIAADHALLEGGLLGLAWLQPHNLFGSGHWLDPLTHGLFWSLSLNALVFYLLSRVSYFTELDLRQANAFIQLRPRFRYSKQDFEPTTIEVRQLHALLEPLVGRERSVQMWQEFEQRIKHRLLPHDLAPRFVLMAIEESLTAIIGAVSAHRAIELLRQQKPLQIEDFMSFVGGTSKHLQFSQELLQTTIETIPQGISVVNQDQQLVAWNSRYEELFQYPPRLLYVGCPIERIYRYNAERGYVGKGDAHQDIEREVSKRLQLLRSGSGYRIERQLPNGTVIEIRGTPMVSGGYVTTYTDITEHQSVVNELERIRHNLEARVVARTAELSQANSSLQKENQLRGRIERELATVHASKSRLLAAASHDLLQPINAARLFVAALQHRAEQGGADGQAELEHLDSALQSTEELIGTLREIARLDSGKLKVKREHFAISDLLSTLASEFSALAARHEVEFEWVDSSLWVYSDRALLRRVLQNFLSNALRYTRRGRVLLGVRRRGECLAIEVWDTGPGISEQDRQRIFDEFERLHEGSGDVQKGLGLGLSIAQRISQLLRHPIGLDSWPGRGSVFRIEVPCGQEDLGAVAQRPRQYDLELSGARVLCVDNEEAILLGMQALLEGWGCQVTIAGGLGEALERWKDERPPELVLADYHLDHGESGLDLLQALGYHWQQPISGMIISADNSEELRNLVREQSYLFMAKPVQPAGLRTAMRRLLKQSRRLRPRTPTEEA